MSRLAKELEEDIVRAFGLRRCVIHAHLGVGISVSTAVLVYYFAPTGCEVRLGVVKVTQRREDYEREVIGHASAAKSWLRPVVPGTPQQSEEGQSFLIHPVSSWVKP